MNKSIFNSFIALFLGIAAFAQSNQVHYSASLGFGFIEEFSFKKDVSALLNPTLFDCGCYDSKPYSYQPESYRYCTRAKDIVLVLSRIRGKSFESLKFDYYRNAQEMGIQGSSIRIKYLQLSYYYGRTVKSWINNRIELTPIIGLMGRYGYDEFFVDYGSESDLSNLRRSLADFAISLGPQITHNFYRRFSFSTKISYDRWIYIHNNRQRPKSVFGDKASNQVNLKFTLNYRFYTRDLDK